jgi:hypothetical protein
MRSALGVAVAVILTLPVAVPAQQLEPRAYSPSPVGANFVGLGYVYSTGGVLFDPSLPITNAHADINSVAVGYGRTFGIGGMQGLVTANIPYAWGILTGVVGTKDSMTTRSGLGDLQVKLSLNLIGSPALSPQAFASTPPHSFILGASLLVSAPTGQYYPTKVINISTNRWAFKPELGVSYIVDRKLYIDFYTGLWLFTDNTQLYPGSSVSAQQAMASLQLHVSYTFSRRIWAALDGTWYSGGATSTNGGPQVGRQDNSRVGAQAAFKITAAQSIKASYSKGATARVGANFSTYALAYQFLWF